MMHLLGGRRQVAQFFITGGLLGVLLFGTAALAFVPEAVALTDEEREERRAERDAEREARRAEREERRAERDAEREARRAEREAEDEAEETGCSCKARLKFTRPSLQWTSNGLSFIPRVDVSISTRGETDAPAWSADLVYSGSASFASDTVALPSNQSFGGTQAIASGPCGDNRYSFKGLALTPLHLSDLSRSLFGDDDELDGAIEMSAEVVGCGFDEEHRMFRFNVSEFGDLRVGGWRSVR